MLTGKLKLGGIEYQLEDLTLGDLEELEELSGKPMNEINVRSARSLLIIWWLFRREQEPELTLDDLRSEKISVLFVTGDDEVELEDDEREAMPSAESPPAFGLGGEEPLKDDELESDRAHSEHDDSGAPG